MANNSYDAGGNDDMRCNQCEALSINGVYTHETGCPNRNRIKRDNEWVDKEPEYDGDDEPFDYDEDRDELREPDEDEVYCPACGGFGGESYGSDDGVCETCGGSGCVSVEDYDNDDEYNEEEDDA